MFDDQEDMFDDEFEDMGQEPHKIDEIIQMYQNMMIARLAKENYEMIVTRGFDASNWDQDQVDAIILTVDYMISNFEAEEKYEECAHLMKARQAIERRARFKPVNI